MSKLFVRHLVVNSCVIVVVFVCYLFLNINIINADSTEPENGYDYSDVLPFDWNPSHYKDYNYLNTNTNVMSVKSGNKIYNIAFYSYRESYYRFEVAKFIIKGDIDPDNLIIQIYQNGVLLPPYKGPDNLIIRNTDNDNEWVAYWFYDWTTPTGSYQAALYIDGVLAVTSGFNYIKREQIDFNRTLTMIDLESNTPTYNRNIYNPSFESVNFIDGLTNWMDYADIDCFLNLSGETTGWNSVTPEDPWEYYCFKNLEYIGQAVRSLDKMVGAYIMCFYTPEDGWVKGGYNAAQTLTVFSNGNVGLDDSGFVSFKDEKRYQDIVELAGYFNELDYVNMIGFDFIRFGENAGLENAERFVKEMNISTPDNWENYSEYQKSIWLGKKLSVYYDSDMINQWRLWKAHMTSEFVYRVRTEANITKPIWAFTLGWNHGTHHGQDPFMLTDAGVIADFVMMYEATPEMYDSMDWQWTSYLNKGEKLNFIPGNQLDAVILDSKDDRNPVEEYYYRLTSAVDFPNYVSQGVFIHDMIRAFWGRKGNHTYYEWLFSGMSAASYNRWQNGEIPFSMTINDISDELNQFAISIDFKDNMLHNITGKELFIENQGQNIVQKVDITGKTNIIMYANLDTFQNESNFIGLRGKIEGYPAYFTFKYFDNQKTTNSE